MMTGNLRIGGAGSKKQLCVALCLAQHFENTLVIGNQSGQRRTVGIGQPALPGGFQLFGFLPAGGDISRNRTIGNAIIKICQVPGGAAVRHLIMSSLTWHTGELPLSGYGETDRLTQPPQAFILSTGTRNTGPFRPAARIGLAPTGKEP